jgi:signal peptidase II
MSFTRNHLFGLAIALTVFALDQWVKGLMVGAFKLRQKIEVEITSFFSFHYAENKGVSFGLLPAESMEARFVLIGLTGLIALIVFVWMLREKKLVDILALAAILGGAMGNIWDRYSEGFVIDYLDLHFFGVSIFNIFNLADAWITLGVVIILARSFFLREKRDETGEPAQPGTGQDGAEAPAETN